MKRLLPIAALALAGCETMYPGISDGRQAVSSGMVGCPPTEVVISNGGQNHWTATCRGRVYHCSYTVGVACAPAAR